MGKFPTDVPVKSLTIRLVTGRSVGKTPTDKVAKVLIIWRKVVYLRYARIEKEGA